MKVLQSSSQLNNANSRPASVVRPVANSLASNSTTREKQVHKSDNPAPLKIQKKLTIGQPNDAYEQEADRIADQVVNTAASKDSKVQKQEEEELQTKPQPSIMRMEEEEVQTKPISLIQRQVPEELQAKTEDSTNQEASGDVTNQINASRGSGSPMPSPIQQSMESGIGADFSGVRIHTDSRAQNLSAQLNAQAFTVGNDVYFNKGKYNPESASGKHLLAHELTHTVQQGAAQQVQKKPNSNVPQISNSSSGIQRLVFFNGNHIPKESPEFKTTQEAEMAGDGLVREFTNKAEMERYNARSTDYIGNLKEPQDSTYEGVWLRFGETGTNVLGENHSKVSLFDSLKAIGGTKSFKRERFSPEHFEDTPTLQNAYEKVNEEEFKKYGIDQEKDKSKYGLEPLEPKIGQAMGKLAHGMVNSKVFSDYKSTSGDQLGKRLVYFLKLAWAYMSDYAQKIGKIDMSDQDKEQKQFLSTFYSKHTLLGTFINRLDESKFIADQIEQEPNTDKLKSMLLSFSEMVVTHVWEKNKVTSKYPVVSNWEKIGFGAFHDAKDDYMLSTKKADEGSFDETLKQNKRNGSFNKLREEKIAESIEDGIKKDVRYIGLGASHFSSIKPDIKGKGIHWFNMDKDEINAFKDKTDKLKKIVTK